MLKFLATVSAIALAVFAYFYWHRPIRYPAGVLIPSEPQQSAPSDSTSSFERGPFHLKPLAHFALDARVLHRKSYHYDRQSALAPIDLALGWGPMSDQSVIDRIEISQSMRFFWYEYHLPPPIPIDQIISHASNFHIIPATPAIERQCNSLRIGALIRLNGELVEATGPGIGTWRSSLSRTDSGNGACELIWVEELHLIKPNGLDAGAQLVRR